MPTWQSFRYGTAGAPVPARCCAAACQRETGAMHGRGQGGVNPDSKKAVRRRKEARERQPEHHAAGLGDEIEAASLATSKSRAARKRSRQVDEDEARAVARARPPRAAGRD